MVCNELSSHMPLQQETRYIFFVNRLVVYSFPTAVNSLTGDHTINFFYLLKMNFRNLLFDLLITGHIFENLTYLSSCSLSKSLRFQRINCKSDLAYIKALGINCQYILWSGSLWHPLNSSIARTKEIVLLITSKLMPAFSLWLNNLV